MPGPRAATGTAQQRPAKEAAVEQHDPQPHDEGRLSEQERTGIGYVGLTVIGIFACLVIFLVIWLVAR